VAHFTLVENAEGKGFVLIPREPGGVARVEIVLDPRCRPSSILVLDPQGSSNRFHFGEWRASALPPDKDWLPAPPQGVACSQDMD